MDQTKHIEKYINDNIKDIDFKFVMKSGIHSTYTFNHKGGKSGAIFPDSYSKERILESMEGILKE